MKKTIYILLIVAIAFGCSENKKDQFKISGTVKGADTGMVYLLKFDSKWQKLDSAQVQNGKFTFTGKVDMPEFYQVSLSGKQVPVVFFIENSDIDISIDADSVELSVVKGSATHDLYMTYLSERENIDKQMNEAGEKWTAAKEVKDSLKMVQAEEEMDSLDALYKKLILDFASKNSGSVVSPYLVIRNAWQFELADLDSVYAGMDTVAKKSIYASAIGKRIDILKKVQIGEIAPDFTMADTNGKEVALSSFKGKYLLVDFWASWCGPCRQENPNVVGAWKNYNNKGFDVLGVSFDRDKTKWENAIKEDNLTWTQVSDLAGWDNSAGKIYGINSIPSNVLLDPEQKIIGRNLRGEELNTKLEELFGKPVVQKPKGRKNNKD